MLCSERFISHKATMTAQPWQSHGWQRVSLVQALCFTGLQRITSTVLQRASILSIRSTTIPQDIFIIARSKSWRSSSHKKQCVCFCEVWRRDSRLNYVFIAVWHKVLLCRWDWTNSEEVLVQDPSQKWPRCSIYIWSHRYCQMCSGYSLDARVWTSGALHMHIC